MGEEEILTQVLKDLVVRRIEFLFNCLRFFSYVRVGPMRKGLCSTVFILEKKKKRERDKKERKKRGRVEIFRKKKHKIVDSENKILILLGKPFRIMEQIESVCFSFVVINLRHCASVQLLCCRPREVILSWASEYKRSTIAFHNDDQDIKGR